MRILLKILLFPVVLVLTVLVAFCRFFCLFSGLILGILAGLLFLIGLLVLFAGGWTASSDLWCWRGLSVPTVCRWQPPG